MHKLVRYTWIAVAPALLYLAWFGIARYEGSQTPPAPPRNHGAYVGSRSTEVRITQFYASPGEVTEGQRTVACYGVENARAVRIDPPVEELKPAFVNCFWIEPRGTTTYTLVAEDVAGKRVSATFTVTVKPAPPEILFVAQSEKEITRGEPVTMCYGVAHATAVRLEPIGMTLAPSPKQCIRIFPTNTMRFTLVATGDAGRIDREKFTVKVH